LDKKYQYIKVFDARVHNSCTQKVSVGAQIRASPQSLWRTSPTRPGTIAVIELHVVRPTPP
jgi:hypothetical protein